MIKIALCDDDSRELEHLALLLKDYLDEKSTEYEYTLFHNGLELITVLEKGGSFDLYFLDILMQGFDGISLGKEIRAYDRKALIIFITSSPSFALDSYSVKAANYLLKPVTAEVLKNILPDVLEQLMEKASPFIVVKSSLGLQKIPLQYLVYMEAMGRSVIYHTSLGQNVKCSCKFSQACEDLTAFRFFLKPHRSYLVNMNYIDTIGHTEIRLQTGDSIPIAQGHVREIKDLYLNFQMEER